MSGLLIGVCGQGVVGQRHTRLLNGLPGIRVSVFDAGSPTPSSARASLRAALPGGLRAADSFHGLLESGLDGLVVATGESTRVGQAIAACERGIPVLIEKPVADAVAAATALQRAASARRVPVLVGYTARHGAVLRLVHDVLTAGGIGTPVSCHVQRTGYGLPDPALGHLVHQVPYRHSQCWDYLRWLLGPALAVCATATAGGQPPVGIRTSPGTATLTMVDGVLAFTAATATFHLDAARDDRRSRGHELSVVGDAGTLHADLVAGMVTVRSRRGVHRYERIEQPDAALVRQLRHFVAVARGDEEPRVTAGDGVAALRVADAVVAACAEHSWQQIRDSAGP